MSKTMRKLRGPLAVVAVSALALGMPIAAEAADPDQQSSFGRMFPGLQGFTPSDQSLIALAATQLDAGKAQLDIAGTPSGSTYFGQFIDHDLTQDGQPLPTAPVAQPRC